MNTKLQASNIEQLKKLIDKAIAEINLNTEPTELYKPISYSMEMGGKRMRPLLALMGCELFGGNIEEAVEPALAIEVFHNFTLVHDDIMDAAPLRRNHTTVYKKWDANTAILSGDAMMILAYQYLAKCPENLFLPIFNLFNKTAMEVCEGQQLDMNFETSDSVSIAQYLEMIEKKTAVLLACSLQMGAMLANASERDAKLLYDFGKHIGIAFQLQDDILDVYGNPEKFGKQVGGDILANKKTYLLLKAIEKADTETQQEIDQLLTDNSFPDSDKVKRTTAIYDSLEIRPLAETEMDKHYNAGMEAIGEIPVSADKKEPLVSFAKKLMQREQ